MTTTLQGHRLFNLVAAILLVALCIGCAPVAPPIEHTVEVQDANSGEPVADANVQGEIGLRYVVNGSTGRDGRTTLVFDPVRMELHNWVKFTVSAPDYTTGTTLAQVETASPPTVVELVAVGAEAPAEEASTPAESPAEDD